MDMWPRWPSGGHERNIGFRRRWYLRTYTTNWLGFVARHNKVGANFLPEAGFIERVDAKQDEAGLSLGLSLSPRPKIR